MEAPTSAALRLALAVGAALASAGCQRDTDPQDAAQDAAQDAVHDSVLGAFRAEGVEVDAAGGLVLCPARVAIRHDLLEFLLVAPHGSVHESLFVTEVAPTAMNAALLLAGATPGRNASWVARDPAPTPAELAAGVKPYRMIAPSGDGFLVYAAWRCAGERYLFRVEDLIADLGAERGMRRQSWVYLGSRFARVRSSEDPAFVAELEGNLVNIALFPEGNTLLTSALPESRSQTNWAANPWIVPPTDAPVALIFARAPITAWPETWTDLVPDHPPRDVPGADSDSDLPTSRPDKPEFDG